MIDLTDAFEQVRSSNLETEKIKDFQDKIDHRIERAMYSQASKLIDTYGTGIKSSINGVSLRLDRTPTTIEIELSRPHESIILSFDRKSGALSNLRSRLWALPEESSANDLLPTPIIENAYKAVLRFAPDPSAADSISRKDFLALKKAMSGKSFLASEDAFRTEEIGGDTIEHSLRILKSHTDFRMEILSKSEDSTKPLCKDVIIVSSNGKLLSAVRNFIARDSTGRLLSTEKLSNIEIQERSSLLTYFLDRRRRG